MKSWTKSRDDDLRRVHPQMRATRALLVLGYPSAGPPLLQRSNSSVPFVQSLRHEIGGFVEVNPEGGKMSRAAAASPQLESGNWYLPHPALKSWVENFIGECAAFPSGAHDDQVDAWSQGAKRLLHHRPKPAPTPYVPRTYSGDRSWMI